MSISERARDLAERIGPIYGGTEEIEQALLAERASVWQEAIKIAEEVRLLPSSEYRWVVDELRAAAEKEVGTK